ncbi:MAG TPA: thiamine phosphate synthase [Dehalococcoidia bacterium]|nr:thiamine phosphate synthase [Dehalococcoidia bacterium]
MTGISRDTLRIIDANLNRIGEGLRVLEEVARLSLNDTGLTQQLKDMRHGITRVGDEFQLKLINARDANGDVGADMLVAGEAKPRNTKDTIIANARRIQESLRVLEEIARVPDLKLDTAKYRNARFTLYTVEKELLQKISRQDKLSKLRGLYVIIDMAMLKGRSYQEVTAQVILGGAGVIQLRDKEHGKKELLAIARDIRDLCREKDILFIVNDYLDIALAVDADGLHVGPEDLPVATARQLLTQDKILGGSARTVNRALALSADGADYIGVGAMFSTGTKERAKVVGIKLLGKIKAAVNMPIVAIGGIKEDNIRDVVRAGADAVAVISAVLGADDIEKATRQLVNIIKGERDE